MSEMTLEQTRDNLAKKLFMAQVSYELKMQEQFQGMADEKKQEFLASFKKVVDECWAGTEDNDEQERAYWRLLAVTAMKTMGYEAEVGDEVVKAFLV